VATLERALELHAVGAPSDLDIATTEFALARALGAGQRAVSLADKARLVYLEHGFDREVAEIDAWQRSRK
jgi:hypothetical protein